MDEIRFQAAKQVIVKYMEIFTDEFKLRPSAFMDFDAEYLTNKILTAIDVAEKEKDLETHATENYEQPR